MVAKMTTTQGYSDVIFLRGGHLGCHFLSEAPRTCQSDFKQKQLQKENVLAHPLGIGILWLFYGQIFMIKKGTLSFTNCLTEVHLIGK